MPHALIEPDAPVQVCRDGVLIPFPAMHASLIDWRRLGDAAVDDLHGLLLPRCRGTDTLVAQPPLAFRPRLAEIAAIQAAETAGVRAASIFGPRQEKVCNEDFALAATFGPRDQPYAFAAVADGVTTRTFWPERSSRIACFTALRTAMDELRAATGDFTATQVDRFRAKLAAALERALIDDQALLTAQEAVPADWNSAQYHRHRGRREFWYNSTLVMALVGPAAGFALWAGDGGLRIEKHLASGPKRVSEPLRSTADPQVSNVVSLAGTIQFGGGRFEIAPELTGIVLTLVTDGADRTQQHIKKRMALEDEDDSERLALALERLSSAPESDVDNYSAAVLRWPLNSIERARRWDIAVSSQLLAATPPLRDPAPADPAKTLTRASASTTRAGYPNPPDKRRSRNR
jgi:hypothetical protein